MLRVAYLCEYSTLLGGERSLITFLKAARRVISPIVVCPESGDLVDALNRENIPTIAWTRSLKKDDDAVFDRLQKEGVEIVHGNSLSLAEVVEQAKAKTRLPAVLHIRDIANLSQRRWTIIKKIDRVLGVSKAVCHWLTAEGVEKSRLHLVYNAVDQDIWNQSVPSLARSDLGLPPNKRLIASIGQIGLRKGQDVFLRACERMANQIEDVDFLVIGQRYSAKEESITFERSLHELSQSRALSGRVHFLGYRHDVPALTRHVDIVVVSSRQEPLSRVLIESLASGVPCVASKVGGNEEIIVDDRFGRTFTIDDDRELADYLIDLLRDTRLAERTRMDGPAFISERFSATRQVQQILDVYKSLLPR